MHIQRRGVVLWLGLLLMIVVVLATFVACYCGSPTFTIIVENQTKYDLTIFVNGHEVGNVSPGEQLSDNDLLYDTTNYHVEAKNTQGEVMFSETLTRQKMQKIDSRVYKVVIPPPPD